MHVYLTFSWVYLISYCISDKINTKAVAMYLCVKDTRRPTLAA